MERLNNLTIRDAKIIFRNFSGKPTQYTPEGRRTFSVVIEDEELANTLANDGWNIKPLKQRDPDEPIHYHLPVAVFFGNYPPLIIMKTGDKRVDLDEATVQCLDWADIKKADLVIRPRTYEALGRKGVKAYLKTLAVTIEEDEIAAEYSHFGEVPEEDLPF